ncbi:hypothetical protein TRICI_006771 [Trichomonascus ciferrii]|uniref:NmrA-like domain-containing protein n=1 Tax=Trichomonascus ciferrii TaxID=44093 RepID=A0A642UDB5_9ASCO|nr:hypothetical protein TRICI_006771 [Trichomonascus ciferrii]
MSEKKILGVLGATGQQGGSVVDFVLNDSELSKQYAIRAFTRDPSKPAAESLAKRGVEVVGGDSGDLDTLKKRLVGVDTLFLMTPMAAGGPITEYETGKGIANAAVEAGVQYIIYSTLPYANKISEGKVSVPHFDDKAKTEEYIRTLPVKSSFYCPGFFMQNFDSMMAPQAQEDGSFAIQVALAGDIKVPIIDVDKDTGNFVGAVLADPEKYNHKTVHAASDFLSMNEVAKLLSDITGKNVKFQQVEAKDYLTFLPEALRDDILSMFLFYKWGFFGPDTESIVKQIDKSPRVPLNTLDKYFRQKPPL